jgi:hypothetical protein
MAGFWSLHCHWRKVRDRDIAHPDLVYLYFFSHYGFPAYPVFCPCVLDEHQTVHSFCKTKSVKVFVSRPSVFKCRERESSIFLLIE